ncbi:protein-L-isoaspartate(D-aspartate) O-methyltransferase-like isoform X2 [Pseudomyrmex gracilis]|uniref:protein-L-isoaspartate(D-aspartate) O-methyltransferase-like isoform X2 n=1 Tax=Pseudomyrmex gracilis TaxID=219809 RepID=UPI000994FA3F|nr:protein-L-isoaspartate(D-aspartate) O-methyltransferase-like isoform X2 [Pseudomyrmex gracilis]
MRFLLLRLVEPVDRRLRSMAWHCNGTTNQEMVNKLKDAGILATDKAEAAMLAVDRAKYCHESDPYLDRPRRIGYNVTISAPHMHAYALSILSDQLIDGARALDVGSGSGYLSACMAFMVGPRGRVIGVEHIPELIEISTRNVREDNPHFLKEGRIKFVGKPPQCLTRSVLYILISVKLKSKLSLRQCLFAILPTRVIYHSTKFNLSSYSRRKKKRPRSPSITYMHSSKKDTRDPSMWSRYVRCREESNGTLSTHYVALL